MGLTDADFDTVVGTLADTLREFKMTEEQVAQAAAVAESTREAVRASRRGPPLLLPRKTPRQRAVARVSLLLPATEKRSPTHPSTTTAWRPSWSHCCAGPIIHCR